ncbi:MAG: hypothetical protein K6G69_09505 [Lachnospiraceae bacterium]|nr:hypothetical protein [Lachnospiraceae bacterium]
MNELMKVTDKDDEKYEQYEELLVRRDQLFKDAGSYMTGYTLEFGEMINANFELKVECIKKKKTISYCRRRINRGLKIDTLHMQEEIEAEMKLYYSQLEDMSRELTDAKNAETISEYRLVRAKKIYRRLAKKLHPDINPGTKKDESLRELWQRITEAYRKSDIDELEDLEALTKKTIEDMGSEKFEIKIKDIDKRIERVERQINEILTTEPYIYGELLRDETKVKNMKESLQSEHENYEQYLEILTKDLEEILREGGATLIWTMN